MLNFLCGMWAGSTIGVLVMCLIQGGKEGEVREDKEKVRRRGRTFFRKNVEISNKNIRKIACIRGNRKV